MKLLKKFSLLKDTFTSGRATNAFVAISHVALSNYSLGKRDIILFDTPTAANDIAFMLGGEWDGCNGVVFPKCDEVAISTAASLVETRWCYAGASLPLLVRFSADELLRRYASGERNFVNANLRYATLSKCLLEGVNLSYAKLCKAALSDANLSGADLTAADLSEADFSKANLSKTCLARTNLCKANLRGADLRGADLSKACLDGANLDEADLRGANLSLADLRGASLNQVNLSGANLQGAKMTLAQERV